MKPTRGLELVRSMPLQSCKSHGIIACEYLLYHFQIHRLNCDGFRYG